MVSGNGKNIFLSEQKERISPARPPGVRATLRMGTGESVTDKRTGRTTIKPTVWGAEKEAPLRRITQDEFLRGSSRRSRRRAFLGSGPIPAH
jgi:hypothetical protein